MRTLPWMYSVVLLTLAPTPLWAQDAPTLTSPPASADASMNNEARDDADTDEADRRRVFHRMLTARIERSRQALEALERGDNIDDIRREYFADFGVERGFGGRFGDRPHPPLPPPDAGMALDGSPRDGLGLGGPEGRGGKRGPGGWDDRRPGDRPDRPEPREMTDADREVMRSVLQVVTPRLAERLDTLAEKDPDEAKRRYERMFGRMRPLVDLKQEDPAMFELKVQEIGTARKSWELARNVLRAELEAAAKPEVQAQADTARAELRANLAKLFDLRVAIRQHDHEMARRRLDEMSDELTRAVTAKDDRVKTQYDQILERVRQHPDREPRGDEDSLAPPLPPPLPPPPHGRDGDRAPPPPPGRE